MVQNKMHANIFSIYAEITSEFEINLVKFELLYVLAKKLQEIPRQTGSNFV